MNKHCQSFRSQLKKFDGDILFQSNTRSDIREKKKGSTAVVLGEEEKRKKEVRV